MEIFDNAVKFMKLLTLLGYEAYIVGGAARDMLSGVPYNDIDIATNCPIDVLKSKFDTYKIGRSKEFGLLLVRYKNYNYEVAQFRTESDYDGPRPTKVEMVSSLREDVKRRDFTINAMALDVDGHFIDHVGGTKDLLDKLVRTVGDPERRFTEDPVRMIRAARFASMEGFRLEKQTRRTIRRMFRLINKVKPERIGLEMYKAADKPGPQFARFIERLDDLKLLAQILPEVTAMKYFRHDLRQHPEGPTVFKHTIECLKLMEDHDWISKLAALLHDIGKCVAFQEDKYWWKMSYRGHAGIGADMAADIMRKLKFSERKVDTVEFAVRNHMKFHELMDMKASKIASLVNNPHFSTLEDVAWADEFCRGETFASYDEFENKMIRVREIKTKWEDRVVNATIRIVDGRKIIELLNIAPGPDVGSIKRAVEEEIIDNGLDPTEEVVNELILKHGGK